MTFVLSKVCFKVDGFIFFCWHFTASFKILFQLLVISFPFFFNDIHMRLLTCKFFSTVQLEFCIVTDSGNSRNYLFFFKLFSSPPPPF